MSSATTIRSRVGVSQADVYWTVDSSGTVTLVTAANDAASRMWSVKNGILYNQGKQIFFDVSRNRFTTTTPLQSTSYPSPVSFKDAADGSLFNWEAVVTTVYPISTGTSSLAQFDTTVVSAAPVPHSLPVYGVLIGGVTYLALGASSTSPNSTMTTKNTIEVREGTTVSPVPLSGFVDAGTGTIVKSDPVVITGASPTSTSWTWYAIAFAIVAVILVIGIIIVFTKKKEVIPLIEEPLVRAALMKR